MAEALEERRLLSITLDPLSANSLIDPGTSATVHVNFHDDVPSESGYSVQVSEDGSPSQSYSVSAPDGQGHLDISLPAPGAQARYRVTVTSHDDENDTLPMRRPRPTFGDLGDGSGGGMSASLPYDSNYKFAPFPKKPRNILPHPASFSKRGEGAIEHSRHSRERVVSRLEVLTAASTFVVSTNKGVIVQLAPSPLRKEFCQFPTGAAARFYRCLNQYQEKRCNSPANRSNPVACSPLPHGELFRS
jgi:hypothetical protein